MAGKHRSTSLMTWSIALLVGSTMAVSCGDSEKSTPKQEAPDAVESRQALLTDVTNNVILPTYTLFEQDIDALLGTVTAWKASPEDAALRLAAQEAWKKAMGTWQQAEVFQVGPAGAMDQVLGGEDYRDSIYSWPLVSSCVVDQTLFRQEFSDLSQKKATARGLDALEYLLFFEDTKNNCAPNSSINKPGEWDSLSAGEIATRRAAYAESLVKDIQSTAKTLHDAWKPEGGNFAATFSAGNVAPYGSTQEALNALSNAMFYIEEETKDMKLAKPAGFKECDGVCPEALEFRWAQFSREAAIANLKGFELLYFGGPDASSATGFDDLLQAVKATDVDTKMQALMADLKTTLNLSVSYQDALAQGGDPAPVKEAYTKAKAVGDLLKTDFISVLDLELPQRAEGDND